MNVQPPAPPYVGPPRWHGGDNRPIRRIVIHAAAGLEPGVAGAARSTADYTKRTDRPSSWHYCADSREHVQLTYDSVVAYHDGTNTRSIGYELCCSLSNQGGVVVRAAAGARALTHWQTRTHRDMLEIAADDVARLCLSEDVPIRRLRPRQVRAGRKGICGHNTMRLAFPGSTTHWDPGPFFPWRRFLRMVQARADELLGPTLTRPLRVGSINLGDGSDADKLADLTDLAGRFHVIGVQEAGDRHPVLYEFLKAHPTWAFFTGQARGSAKVPVLYDRNELRLLPDSTSVTAWAGGWVGEGAGPDRIGPKALTIAVFEHLATGRRVNVLNHHLVASHTRPGLPTRARRARRAAARAQAAAFERWAEDCTGAVFGTGDWNASARWVRRHVDGYLLDSVKAGPTFRRRRIDFVGHFPHPAVRAASTAVVETSGSRSNGDHRAVGVHYRIKERSNR